jgi:putative membrane protein
MSIGHDVSQPRVTAASSSASISTELASRRTGMSFQRTRMSADRTLMSVIRTSLSLIAFGFTIFQFFGKLQESGTRNFGTALVLIGIGVLTLGIVYHVQFMLGLRRTREEMTGDGLIQGQSVFPPSVTLIAASLLLILGLAAVISMLFRVGPFG